MQLLFKISNMKFDYFYCLEYLEYRLHLHSYNNKNEDCSPIIISDKNLMPVKNSYLTQ